MSERKLILPESSELMIENARSKAEAAITQCPEFDFALGDDSGIFIHCLDWFPGVHSRRWTGTDEDDDGRNLKIIKLMENETDREAFLISRFVLVNKEGEIIAKEVVSNRFFISDEPRGGFGFGYDKILIPEDALIDDACKSGRLSYTEARYAKLNKMTIGEMPQDMKNSVNNRGKIAAQIAKTLEKYYKK